MNKHSQSSSIQINEFLSNRCFTPVGKNSKIQLPSLTDENYSPSFQIRSDKKYSILTVPKLSCKEKRVFKPMSSGQVLVRDEEKSSENCIQMDMNAKHERVSFAKLCNIKRRYRSFKNPNEDALKAELAKMGMENKKIEYAEEKGKGKEKEIEKSDIEKILESQVGMKKPKINNLNLWKKKDTFLDLENITEAVQEIYESSSRNSDPSPVREKIRERESKSQTPTNHMKMPKKILSSINALTESEAGKKILNLLQKEKNKSMIRLVRASPKADLSKKIFYDYQQESLKILKDTSSFAGKIMKGIRCGGRIKSIYL